MTCRTLLFIALLISGCGTGMDAVPVDESTDALNDVLRPEVAQATLTSTTINPDDALVTLGRVLFYERQLSRDGTISCASCHRQSDGFADQRRLSEGVGGSLTARHSMSVANVITYPNGRMFWDERASSLEDQALQPIQNPDEMDLTLEEAVSRLNALPYYDVLFQNAFGTDEASAERLASALAAFERTIVTRSSTWDEWLAAGPPPAMGGPGPVADDDRGVLTQLEEEGRRLFFSVRTQCGACHAGPDLVGDRPFNNGLDANTAADQGAGQGRFKTASLRNVELTAPYMHDGRFATLRDVIEHYSTGVQAHPALDNRLRNANGDPRRLNLSPREMDALEAFLKTFTDESLAVDDRYSDPFLR